MHAGHLGRRGLLTCLGGVLAGLSPVLHAQNLPPFKKLAVRMRIVIPANENGGWDQTGRALGASLLAAGLCEQVDFENLGGKGGTLGLATFVQKYDQDPNALLVGGSVMVGAVALQRPAVDLSQVQPLVRLTGDYLVMVVKADSPIRSVADLVALVRKDLKGVPLAGGSAGGIDHIFSGLFARAAGAPVGDLVYQPFAGGVQVADAVLSGKAMVGVSGYSEFSDLLAGGKLRAIGVSARKTMFGIPAIREQGVDAVMANWRGLLVGNGVANTRVAELLDGVRRATAHPSWLLALKAKRWDGAWLAGDDLRSFMDLDRTTAAAMAYLLKLKA
jgi:putative tricarboxylic transport membrane protein|nr:tripartite tricarboxylate transporter substrate-binding protein [uncultured Albidiferax sp.]